MLTLSCNFNIATCFFLLKFQRFRVEVKKYQLPDLLPILLKVTNVRTYTITITLTFKVGIYINYI